jgi:hypothetical protein
MERIEIIEKLMQHEAERTPMSISSSTIPQDHADFSG